MKEQVNRVIQINDRQDVMCRTLEGCDWCCGGGDEEWDTLRTEKQEILNQLAQSPEGVAQVVLIALRRIRDTNPKAWDSLSTTDMTDLWDWLRSQIKE